MDYECYKSGGGGGRYVSAAAAVQFVTVSLEHLQFLKDLTRRSFFLASARSLSLLVRSTRDVI